MTIVSQRLQNQKLSAPDFRNPVDVVRWFGAVQSQDFAAAKWALGLRMRNATDALIEDAYNSGQIIRTHVMRPTWHFVAADEIRWLLELTAPRVISKCGPGFRTLELDDAVFKRSNKALTKALKGGKHLTRTALKNVLTRSGIDVTDLRRLAHIVVRAELDRVVCSGPRAGKQFTYALFDERVPATKTLFREEALATLTERYFTSHGPATLHDFVWWSGLTAADVRHGISLVDRHLRKELVREKEYLRARAVSHAPRGLVHLLPAFDEYNVAYKDRQAVVDPNTASLTMLGMLNPMLIVDGRIAGTWRRFNERNSVTLELTLLRTLKKPEKLAVDKAIDRYADFLGVPVNLKLISA